MKCKGKRGKKKSSSKRGGVEPSNPQHAGKEKIEVLLRGREKKGKTKASRS